MYGWKLKGVPSPSFGDRNDGVSIVIGTALLVGGLWFFPVLALGPIVETVIMQDEG